MDLCTVADGCKSTVRYLTMDASRREIKQVGSEDACFTDGQGWDPTPCPDDKTCAGNCQLQGIPEGDWEKVYGITTNGTELRMNYVTKDGDRTNVGARVFLLHDDENYAQFDLASREFSFDVDVSHLPCGVNGALSFVDMSQDGGTMRGNNKAGAKYGTGYCDAQCPRDVKFIQGESNTEGWSQSTGPDDTSKGKYGSCCAEVSIWAANQISSSLVAHPCTGFIP